MLSSDLNPDLSAQREVLRSIEPLVAEYMQRHKDSRKLWMPSDLMPADEQSDASHDAELAALRERARGLPDGVRVALALNLLTEEGLPHFHRLVAVYMGHDGVWAAWNNLWTAEEDRHDPDGQLVDGVRREEGVDEQPAAEDEAVLAASARP